MNLPYETDYKGWNHYLTFRRGIIFTDGEQFVTAIDWGRYRDGDRTWVERLMKEIKQKIDDPATNFEVEGAIARTMEHHFEAHKVLLAESQEMTATEAEDRWGLAKGTVRAALNRGQLQGRKSGNIWMVRVGEMKNQYGEESKGGSSVKR